MASQEIAKLGSDLQARAVARLEALAEDPRPPGCKKLAGSDSRHDARPQGAGEERFDDEERERLHESLRESIEQMKTGQLIDADEALAKLRAHR